MSVILTRNEGVEGSSPFRSLLIRHRKYRGISDLRYFLFGFFRKGDQYGKTVIL